MGVDGQGWGAGASADAAPSARWAHLLLVEITDFASLRRLLGIGRADLLGLDIAERVATLLPHAGVATAGRTLIEVRLATDARGDIDRAVATLHAGFAQPLPIDGELHIVDLLIGTASAPAGAVDEVRLIEEAEAALATVRGRRRSGLPLRAVTPAGDVALGRELRTAIAAGELFLHYQPKLHLRRGEITSVEALIRWHHPTRGLIMPSDFIPVAERSGDIAAVTMWTLRQVIADQRCLFRNGHDLPVFVNIAGALLSGDSFTTAVIDLLDGSGARIGIEITETSVIRDPTSAIANLQRLAAIGVAITIDDYGAGVSSLAYLKQLPAGELKIDKLFVTQLTSSHRDPLIVRSTIDLAHALEMEVVAEGVETPASLALLTVMGCDMVQGYLISRPLTLEALLPYLAEERHVALLQAPRAGLGPLMALRRAG